MTEKQKLKIKNDIILINQVIEIAIKEGKETNYLVDKRKLLLDKLNG